MHVLGKTCCRRLIPERWRFFGFRPEALGERLGDDFPITDSGLPVLTAPLGCCPFGAWLGHPSWPTVNNCSFTRRSPPAESSP